MDILDYQEVKKHIDILNVAYHLCLEIVEEKGFETRAICPFCGYNKNSKIPTMSLNTSENKYCCTRCGAGGYSVGLYARVRNIDTKKAYKELLEKECYSPNKSHIEISPINLLSDIEIRDAVYREFLGMLKLEGQHRRFLRGLGLLDSSIDVGLYRTIPKNYIKRRIVGAELARKYNLAGIPGFFQEEDFKWCFNRYDGFFVPVFDENGYIQGLSIHLDKPFNNNQDIWFSSNNKINGTNAKSWIMKNNVTDKSNSVIITDNFLLGNLINETINAPMIAFQNISNSYIILKEIERTNIKDILFVIRLPQANENLDYIINRIFRDLIPLNYNLDIKYINDYKDFFDKDFNVTYTLNKAA